LATQLVLALVTLITARGETACLHAVATNVTAIRLYERLGFTVRREVEVALLRAP
jgi:predicted GNAT family acetyltransferase